MGGAVVSFFESVCSSIGLLTDDGQIFRGSEAVLSVIVDAVVTVVMAVAEAVVAFFKSLANCFR